MGIRFVIGLKKVWMFVWKVWKKRWLNRRKKKEVNKNGVKILGVKNKWVNLEGFGWG